MLQIELFCININLKKITYTERNNLFIIINFVFRSIILIWILKFKFPYMLILIINSCNFVSFCLFSITFILFTSDLFWSEEDNSHIDVFFLPSLITKTHKCFKRQKRQVRFVLFSSLAEL